MILITARQSTSDAHLFFSFCLSFHMSVRLNSFIKRPFCSFWRVSVGRYACAIVILCFSYSVTTHKCLKRQTANSTSRPLDSFTFVLIESHYVTSYYWLIVHDQSISRTVSEIWGCCRETVTAPTSCSTRSLRRSSPLLININYLLITTNTQIRY